MRRMLIFALIGLSSLATNASADTTVTSAAIPTNLHVYNENGDTFVDHVIGGRHIYCHMQHVLFHVDKSCYGETSHTYRLRK